MDHLFYHYMSIVEIILLVAAAFLLWDRYRIGRYAAVPSSVEV